MDKDGGRAQLFVFSGRATTFSPSPNFGLHSRFPPRYGDGLEDSSLTGDCSFTGDWEPLGNGICEGLLVSSSSSSWALA